MFVDDSMPRVARRCAWIALCVHHLISRRVRIAGDERAC